MASINFPNEETEIIKRWREIKAFETQVRLTTTCGTERDAFILMNHLCR